MNKLAMVVVVLAAACGGKKSDDNSEQTASAKPADTTTCPMPTAERVQDRFPVGTQPDYRVNSMVGEAPKCHDEFVASDVVVMEGGRPKLVKEGTFQGHCPGEPDNKRTFEAVKPAKAVISVSATHVDLGGELGPNKPVMLDSKLPDKRAGVTAGVVDRCGTPLKLGVPGFVTTWTLGTGCEKVAKVEPYETTEGPDKAKSQEMQVVAIGPGTCTLTAELFGVTGETTITVK